MRDPSTYTDQELSQLYKLVLYGRGDHPHGAAYISDHKGLYWGYPAEFTLQEARDHLGTRASVLEKMRTVKPGETRRLTNRVRGHHDWGVYRVDPAVEHQIIALEQQANKLKEEIDLAAGLLIKQRAEIMARLKALKENRAKT